MLKLSMPSGLLGEADSSLDGSDKIIRPAILVHVGEFMSGDGPISFDEERIHSVIDNHNAQINKLAKEYGGFEKMPLGAFPPILDQHEQDSNNRIIGRLAALLSFEKRDIPKVGKNIPCATTQITFLGSDTVEKVKDGRIYHLSIGINEDDNTLGEVSVVIEPAAPGAMLLSKNKTKSKLRGEVRMSKKKNLEAKKLRLSKLTALKSLLDESSSKLEKTKSMVKLTQKKGQVSIRLSGLMRAGKMTPAEYKNVLAENGLTKLAKLDADTLKIALSAFEGREKPVVEVGQKGSSSATDFSEIGNNLEKRQMKRMASEIRGDFKKMAGRKLSFKDEDKFEPEDKKDMSGPVEKEINPGKDDHAVPGQAGDEKFMAHLSEMGKHLANGDIEKAKESHAAMTAQCKMGGDEKSLSEGPGDVKSEDYKMAMDDLQSQVDDLNTQLARMAGMVTEMMGSDEEEDGKKLDQGDASDEGDEE